MVYDVLMKEACGYLRVSGKSQLDGDGFPRQRLAIEGHAAACGLTITQWYEERAVCGATEWENRPAWAVMVAELAERPIVIECLNRLARDLMVQEHIIADLRRRRIVLMSAEEPDLGSDEPSRVLMRQIMGAIAQYDRCMIVRKLHGARQRQRAGDGSQGIAALPLAERLAAGGARCEGRKPYGAAPGEAEVLAEMRAAHAAGAPAAAIARDLTNRGVLTRSGRPWHPFTVQRILQR